MNCKHLLLILFAACFFNIKTILAQNSYLSSGGVFSETQGSISYSIGYAVNETYNSYNISLVQGLQQPFEISVATGINDIEMSDFPISAYPNPTTNFLKLAINSDVVAKCQLVYKLYDTSGKLIYCEHFKNSETQISFKHLKPALYILKIVENDTPIKTLKIVKQ